MRRAGLQLVLVSLAVFKDLRIDANDAAALGVFWSEALGLEVRHKANGSAVLAGTSGAHPVRVNRVPWIVIADPEGGELCLFVSDAPPS